MKLWFLLIIFLVGLGIGLAAPSMAPKYLDPYFPNALQTAHGPVQGTVVRKQHEENRLLLTISAVDGALLATFKKQVTEISLLVEEGDTLSLDVKTYAPFVTDPPILRVKKPQNDILPQVTDPILNNMPTASPSESSPASSLPEDPSETPDDLTPLLPEADVLPDSST